MKRLVVFILFLSFSLNSFAQKIPKHVVKRAHSASEHISNVLNFNETQQNHLHEILIKKYDSNRKSIHGKNLSQDQKREIYRASFIETKKDLSEKFSPNEVNMINKHHREWQKKNNKK